MPRYRVQIAASALKNRSVAAFQVDEAQLGAAVVAVLDVPRWVTAWIGVTDGRDDAPLWSEELGAAVQVMLAEPFVIALEHASDPRAAALEAAAAIIERVGGEMREADGRVEVFLPGRTEPEVLLVYSAAATTLQ
jgi:hypothetical protein